METTIKLNKLIKERLDSFKVHSRESYNEVISRMIKECGNMNIDKESLRETIEILGDPETMRNIAESLENFNKGYNGISWEDLKK